MKRQQSSNASSLFLIELILSILFFSLTGAVCVQIFVKSHTMSQDSEALSQSVNLCASAAEICQAADSMEDALSMMQELYDGQADLSDETSSSAVLQLFYDPDFAACPPETCAYRMTVSFQTENSMLHADIRMETADGGKEIYTLKTTHYLAKEADTDE